VETDGRTTDGTGPIAVLCPLTQWIIIVKEFDHTSPRNTNVNTAYTVSVGYRPQDEIDGVDGLSLPHQHFVVLERLLAQQNDV